MRIAFVASDTSVAQQARRKLVDRYGDVPAEQAELIVALGGDGFMLRTLHTYCALEVPVYGMKLGRVGFLMNKHRLDGLPERVARAHTASLFPLQMHVTAADGAEYSKLAFNEVSLLRQSNQAAPAAGCECAGADPDQPVPPAPLARCDPAASHRGDSARTRSAQAAGQRHRRFP
jgi:NAD+ kinase